MARNATETRFQSQRDKILKAAATCFNQKGFSGTSLKDVSRHLGLTDAALYYYVRNKEELVYQCYLRAAELGQKAMERGVAEGQSGFEQAYLYIRYHVEIMVGDEGPVAIMSEILRNGMDDGSISPCDVRMTGNAIMGSINWIPKWFHGKSSVAQEICDEFPEILTRGIKKSA